MIVLALSLMATEPAVDGDALARRVAREREEIEQLAAEVDAARQAARAELLALESRERELDAELSSASLKLAALRAETERVRGELSATGVGRVEDDRVVADAIARARVLLDETVPFDREVRAARLDHAAASLTSFGAGAAAPLLWRHLEAEQALARAVGRGRQVVTVGDKRIRADTLHIGLALLFFKTGGGTVGMAERRDGTWRWHVADDPGGRTRIGALFDAARHGAPSGVFLVPNPLEPITAQVRP